MRSKPTNLLQGEMSAAVPAPAGFLRLGAKRFLLPIADSRELLFPAAQPFKVVKHGLGPAFPKTEVVFVGPALVAVALDLEPSLRVLFQEVRDSLQVVLGGFSKRSLVETKLDGLECLFCGSSVGGMSFRFSLSCGLGLDVGRALRICLGLSARVLISPGLVIGLE